MTRKVFQVGLEGWYRLAEVEEKGGCCWGRRDSPEGHSKSGIEPPRASNITTVKSEGDLLIGHPVPL